MMFKTKQVAGAGLKGALLFTVAILAHASAQASEPARDVVLTAELDARIEKATAMVRGPDGVIRLLVKSSSERSKGSEPDAGAKGERSADGVARPQQ